MNPKSLVLVAVAFTFVCSVAGKIHHHHHVEDEEEKHSEDAKEETATSEEGHGHHHGHHHHHKHHHGHHHHHHHFQCKGHNVTFTDDQKIALKTCWNELKERMPTHAPSDKKHKHRKPKPDACFIACKFEKLELIEDGKLDMDAVEKQIDTMFPEVAREELKKAYGKCNDNLNEELTKEDGCKSYIPLAKCIWKSLKKVCHSDKKHHKHHHHHQKHHE